MKPKSINALMTYMRDNKKIYIKGSLQKKKLRYIGYFHGYKGYRYCNSPRSLLAYQNFNELQAVYDFDMKLKALLYPQIMFLETTLKNYTLEVILNATKSSSFADIYTSIMNDYTSYPIGSANYKKSLSKKMNVRNKIYSNISRDYGKNNIVHHYYDKDQPVPIWAIFELISLGEFGNIVSCLNNNIRKDISLAIGINPAFDTNGKKIEKIIFTLKDLRNSVAHNNTIFDTRFKTNDIDKGISNYITSEITIKDINFSTIVDYVILIAFLMKKLKCNKSDILSFIKQFEDSCEKLRKLVPMNIYSKIIYTNTRSKLSLLKTFV
ncbi:MAG: Abi family protein [Lachnospirales bacterium]